MSQKRNRSINWDEEEKQLFRSVLKEYAQIIENKSLDTNTNQIKNKAWEQVHKKFNELNRRHRDLIQLKIQWKTMKVNARKTCSVYNRESNKTGGGPRPVIPGDADSEIKDLLNPAELLRDQNIFDSDGIILGELEVPTSIGVYSINLQDSKQIINHVDSSNSLKDIDAQVNIQLSAPLASQENAIIASPIDTNINSIPVKIPDDISMTATPVRKITSTIPKEPAKRKLLCMKPKKGNEDYINSMINHSKMLKDEEHMRHMEMAEEEHAIKMEIHKQKLKCVILEREILEIKKARESM